MDQDEWLLLTPSSTSTQFCAIRTNPADYCRDSRRKTIFIPMMPVIRRWLMQSTSLSFISSHLQEYR